MSTGISEQYRLLDADQVEQFAAEAADAWKSADIPARQFNLVVSEELENYRAGKPILPYDVLVECLRMLPTMNEPTVLDIGAASGYYSQVLKIAGFDCHYGGIDFSPSFCQQAWEKFSAVVELGDARQLRIDDNSADIVLHGATLMHCREYQLAIEEAERVSKRYVIFHRTAIVEGRPTEFWTKEAYGVPCLEVHIEHAELMQIFESLGLKVLFTKDLFFDEEAKSGHRTYVLEKANA